jgi:hypothetical protein
MEVFSWPVTLVNNQEISRNGFLKQLTCNLVISSGMSTGFFKNSSKISRSLSYFFNNSLQSSPLKVSVGSQSLLSLRNT